MTRRRPILGGIAFALVAMAILGAGGIVLYAHQQTVDAFVPGPPWWALATTIGVIPVGALAALGFLLGIAGAVRREKPGWPAIAALFLAPPVLGAVAVSGYLWFVVTVSCATPPGACG